jgi:hypothetical protein
MYYRYDSYIAKEGIFVRHKNLLWVFLFVFSTLLASGLAFVSRCEAAAPDIAWETALDSYSDLSYSSSLQATSDGGVAFAGWGNDGTGNYAVKITKLGAGGAVAWETALDSSYSYYSYSSSPSPSSYSLHATSDGGVAFAGLAKDGMGSYAIKITKLGAGGAVAWKTALDYSYSYSLLATFDGGVAFAGWAKDGTGSYTAKITKLGAGGAVAWKTALDYYSSSYSYSLLATSDGGVAFTGWTDDGTGNYAAKITKLGAGGAVAWETVLDSSYSYFLQATSDGGVAFVWRANDGTGSYATKITKLGAGGAVAWETALDYYYYYYYYYLQATTDGGIAFAGWTDSNTVKITKLGGESGPDDPAVQKKAIYFLPGYMGSRLYRKADGAEVWINALNLLADLYNFTIHSIGSALSHSENSESTGAEASITKDEFGTPDIDFDPFNEIKMLEGSSKKIVQSLQRRFDASYGGSGEYDVIFFRTTGLAI